MRAEETRAARRLTLNRETVRELDRTELEKVAAGVAMATIINCPLSITACDCTGNYTYQC